MTGQQLIDAIHKHHLEDLEIENADTELCSGIRLDFYTGTIELPYPQYRDSHCDAPAYIYKSKILYVDDDGNTKCYDTELNTSE